MSYQVSNLQVAVPASTELVQEGAGNHLSHSTLPREIRAVPPEWAHWHEEMLDLMRHIGLSISGFAGHAPDVGGDRKWCVTEYDIESERRFARLIAHFEGDHALWAEEEHYELPESAEHVWAVDPISGTFSFVNGLPHYAVTVAHLYRGEVVFSAIFDPSSGELFTATKGKGAYLERIDGSRERLSVEQGQRDTRYPPIIFDYLTSKMKLGDEFIELFRSVAELGWIKSYGSLALHYAYVAAGRANAALSFNFDTYPEFAGQLILEEAGGRLTDFRGAPLRPFTRGVIASNGGYLHAGLQELVTDINYL